MAHDAAQRLACRLDHCAPHWPRRRLHRACSPPLLGGNRCSPESRQDTFGDFQFNELVASFFPFAIEPCERLGNPQFLLSYQYRDLLVPLVPARPPFAQRPYSPMNAKKSYWKRLESKKLRSGRIFDVTIAISGGEGSLQRRPPSRRENGLPPA
jgi:hypothetical protein